MDSIQFYLWRWGEGHYGFLCLWSLSKFLWLIRLTFYQQICPDVFLPSTCSRCLCPSLPRSFAVGAVCPWLGLQSQISPGWGASLSIARMKGDTSPWIRVPHWSQAWRSSWSSGFCTSWVLYVIGRVHCTAAQRTQTWRESRRSFSLKKTCLGLLINDEIAPSAQASSDGWTKLCFPAVSVILVSDWVPFIFADFYVHQPHSCHTAAAHGAHSCGHSSWAWMSFFNDFFEQIFFQGGLTVQTRLKDTYTCTNIWLKA